MEWNLLIKTASGPPPFHHEYMIERNSEPPYLVLYPSVADLSRVAYKMNLKLNILEGKDINDALERVIVLMLLVRSLTTNGKPYNFALKYRTTIHDSLNVFENNFHENLDTILMYISYSTVEDLQRLYTAIKEENNCYNEDALEFPIDRFV